MHRSGAQSASVEHDFWHAPWVVPTQVWAPPQFSPFVQAHVPLVQIPLEQSELLVHVKAAHCPPHVLPEPQSLLDAQELALHFAPVHVADLPQSAAELHDAGGVHFAPVHVPVRQSLSPLQMDLLHFALLHWLPTVHETSPVQLSVLHFAPVQLLLDGQPTSPAHAAELPHFAPVHELLDGHAASLVHAGTLLHFAPEQVLPTGHVASAPHVWVLHLAPLQAPPTGHPAFPAQVALLHFAPVQV
jgi:hypothetical protein